MYACCPDYGLTGFHFLHNQLTNRYKNQVYELRKAKTPFYSRYANFHHILELLLLLYSPAVQNKLRFDELKVLNPANYRVYLSSIYIPQEVILAYF